ncbi:MAG TPA: putative sugar O-methyltransferase [Syntrophales bacterium]|nr:putative sugar O-methyltransferase [Syntrophales bacterium]HPC01587.1 putative sugar O-methyltransferase [Syntrophales bacterium]HRS87495.1 putative sugar O-methyltransferase [Syntrophales bacterium]HRV43089.1 putative sugar O-methyltransferase [Syntrophales bacterium]
MKDITPRASALWERINETYLTPESLEDLSNFKRDRVNYKISLWNPHTNGVRYLKTLLYNLCSSLSEENRRRLANTRGREFGNPITVRYDGQEICLDYLQAAWELEFLERHLPRPLAGAAILEIGAGYGRTCHTILSNHDPSLYCIVDLDNCLTLAQRYLKTVLSPGAYERIRFLPVTSIDYLEGMHFHLAVNIDSFAEMEAPTVRYYLDYINRRCDHLYVKNPVGKYDDPSLDAAPVGEEVAAARRMGLLLDVVDINDNLDILKNAKKFIEAYRPAPTWTCLAEGWAPPWSFYWQALYGRGGETRGRRE